MVEFYRLLIGDASLNPLTVGFLKTVGKQKKIVFNTSFLYSVSVVSHVNIDS